MGENKQGDGDEAKSESKKGVIFFFVCLLLVGAGLLVARGGIGGLVDDEVQKRAEWEPGAAAVQNVALEPPMMAEIKRAASAGNVKEVKALTAKLSGEEPRAKALAYIKAAETNAKLNALEASLAAGDHAAVQSGLQGLTWVPLEASTAKSGLAPPAQGRVVALDDALQQDFNAQKSALAGKLPEGMKVTSKTGAPGGAPAGGAGSGDSAGGVGALPLGLGLPGGGGGSAGGGLPGGGLDPTGMVTAHIKLNDKKADGTAWDASGGLPDLALCYTVDGARVCTPGGGASIPPGGKAQCKDSLSCRFQVHPRATNIQVIDVDEGRNEVVGSGTCKPGGMCRLGSMSIGMSAVRPTAKAGAAKTAPKAAGAKGGENDPIGNAVKRRATGGENDPIGNAVKHRATGGENDPVGNAVKRRATGGENDPIGNAVKRPTRPRPKPRRQRPSTGSAF
jgi:hypothetical protein